MQRYACKCDQHLHKSIYDAQLFMKAPSIDIYIFRACRPEQEKQAQRNLGRPTNPSPHICVSRNCKALIQIGCSCTLTELVFHLSRCLGCLLPFADLSRHPPLHPRYHQYHQPPHRRSPKSVLPALQPPLLALPPYYQFLPVMGLHPLSHCLGEQEQKSSENDKLSTALTGNSNDFLRYGITGFIGLLKWWHSLHQTEVTLTLMFPTASSRHTSYNWGNN